MWFDGFSVVAGTTGAGAGAGAGTGAASPASKASYEGGGSDFPEMRARGSIEKLTRLHRQPSWPQPEPQRVCRCRYRWGLRSS